MRLTKFCSASKLLNFFFGNQQKPLGKMSSMSGSLEWVLYSPGYYFSYLVISLIFLNKLSIFCFLSLDVLDGRPGTHYLILLVCKGYHRQIPEIIWLKQYNLFPRGFEFQDQGACSLVSVRMCFLVHGHDGSGEGALPGHF